jgi:hypothetical protein
MDTQSTNNTVEIIGMELLHVAELKSLLEGLDEMSFSDDASDDDCYYANDSLNLARVTAGARRRTHHRRNSSDSYANDSVELTRRFRKTSQEQSNKDRLPSEMIFAPLKSDGDSPVAKSKDFPSTHLGAKNLTKLQPHRPTNCAA